MNIENKISLVKENKSELKGEYKVDTARVPVKVIGIGPQALKILVLEASSFTATPVWKQHWINFEKDILEAKKERAIMLIEEMVKSISQSTL